MNKSPEAFRTISEVAETLDVPPHVLRFWETRFTQVKPVKRGGGRRYYRPEDVRLLRGIRGLLYNDGMTIKGVQKILRERGIRHVIGLGTLPDDLAPEAAPDRELRIESAVVEVFETAPDDEDEAAPAAAVNGAGHGGRSQADLFESGVTEQVMTAAPKAGTTATPTPLAGGAKAGDAKAGDKAALKALVAELQALREVMAEEPGRD